MSEVKTTRLLNYEVEQNSWKNIFPNQVWQDYYKWLRYGFVDVAYEYVFKGFDETTVEFPFVVKTKAPVKEVWKFDLKLPVKKINYGTKFTIPAGATTFYFADNFKLPANALRRVVYEFLRLFSEIVIVSDLAELKFQFGVLGEIPITVRPTEFRFEVYDVNGYLLATAKTSEFQLHLALNLFSEIVIASDLAELKFQFSVLGEIPIMTKPTEEFWFEVYDVNGYLLTTAKTNELQFHLALNGQSVVSANIHEIYTNTCGLTSWTKFYNGEWQSCDTWT